MRNSSIITRFHKVAMKRHEKQLKFIDEMKQRPPIWDKSSLHHKDHTLVNRLWVELAHMFCMSKADTKKFWKNLLDQFRRRYKAASKSGSSTGSESLESDSTRWPLFRPMMFMVSSFRQRSPLALPEVNVEAVIESSASVSGVDVVVNQDLEVSQTSKPLHHSFAPEPPEPVVQSTLPMSPPISILPKPTQSEEATSRVAQQQQQQVQLAGDHLQQVYNPIGPFAQYVNYLMTKIPPNITSLCETRVLEVIRLCENGHEPLVSVACASTLE